MIRFGSRGSVLALAQTEQVARALRELSGEEHTVEVVRTRGDTAPEAVLRELPGKGFFTSELEEALRTQRIDAAVHSFKDLPVEDAADLCVAAVTRREAPEDCLVGARSARDEAGAFLPLAHGARVGTSSLRRQAFLKHLRPDLVVEELRGNVTTRISRVREGRVDAALVAGAGLARIGWRGEGDGGPWLHTVPPGLVLPAPAQGALAVQARTGDRRTLDLLAPLHHPPTSDCAMAERSVLALLGGGCTLPLGVLATAAGGAFRLEAALFSGSGAGPLRVALRGRDVRALAAEAASLLRPALTTPLAGRRILVVRPQGRAGPLEDGLAAAGAAVVAAALTRITPLPVDPGALRRAAQCAWIAVASPAAAGALAGALRVAGLPAPDARYAAVGEATAAALEALGLCRDPLLPEQATGEALARALVEEGAARGARVLLPCAEKGREELAETLAGAGAEVLRLPLYRTEAVPPREVPALPSEPVDGTVFTSPSGVKAFLHLGPWPPPGRVVALGPTTARALAEAGVPRVPHPPSPQPAWLVHTLLEELEA